jgi:hypothetical protein
VELLTRLPQRLKQVEAIKEVIRVKVIQSLECDLDFWRTRRCDGKAQSHIEPDHHVIEIVAIYLNGSQVRLILRGGLICPSAEVSENQEPKRRIWDGPTGRSFHRHFRLAPNKNRWFEHNASPRNGN